MPVTITGTLLLPGTAPIVHADRVWKRQGPTVVVFGNERREARVLRFPRTGQRSDEPDPATRDVLRGVATTGHGDQASLAQLVGETTQLVGEFQIRREGQ